MRCPWCGNQVRVGESQWVCDWCGDSGIFIRRTPVQTPAPAQITLTLSLVHRVDLSETWLDMKEALGLLAPRQAMLSQLLGKVLLHNISAGIHAAGSLPEAEKAEELRAFLNDTFDLNLGKRAEGKN